MIALVPDQVRDVITHVRAILRTGSGERVWPQIAQSGIQLRAVIRKIEHALPRRSEDRGAVSGFELADVSRSAVTHSRDVREIQMDVVKKVGDETLGRNRRLLRSSVSTALGHCHLPAGFFHGELRDLLLLAFVEELEIFFRQVPDGLSLRIAHHHRDHH